MMRSVAIGVVMLAATALHAQNVLDIECGWPRDSAMKLMAGKYCVVDTLIKTSRGYDFIIHMAPVEIAGYKGFLALHSNSAGCITGYFWTHQQRNVYLSWDSAAPWNTFTDYIEWPTPAMADFLTMFIRLDEEIDSWADAYALDHAFDSDEPDDTPDSDTTGDADKRAHWHKSKSVSFPRRRE